MSLAARSRAPLARKATSQSARTQKSSRYWLEGENRRRLLAGIAGKGLEGRLNRLTWRQLQDHGGGTLLGYYGNSVSLAVMAEFPEYSWLPWKFSKAPQGWWKTISSYFTQGDPVAECVLRGYVDSLKSESSDTAFPQRRQQNWYHLGHLGIDSMWNLGLGGAHTVTPEHANSHSQAPMDTSDWWRFAPSRRRFVEGLFDLSRLETAYGLNYASFLAQGGGSSLAALYSFSPAATITTECPEVSWDVWRFKHPPRNWWKLLSKLWVSRDPVAEVVVQRYLDWLEEKYNIEASGGWNAFTTTRLTFAEQMQVKILGKLPATLSRVYPEKQIVRQRHQVDPQCRVEQKSLDNNVLRLFPQGAPTYNKEPLR